MLAARGQAPFPIRAIPTGKLFSQTPITSYHSGVPNSKSWLRIFFNLPTCPLRFALKCLFEPVPWYASPRRVILRRNTGTGPRRGITLKGGASGVPLDPSSSSQCPSRSKRWECDLREESRELSWNAWSFTCAVEQAHRLVTRATLSPDHFTSAEASDQPMHASYSLYREFTARTPGAIFPTLFVSPWLHATRCIEIPHRSGHRLVWVEGIRHRSACSHSFARRATSSESDHTLMERSRATIGCVRQTFRPDLPTVALTSPCTERRDPLLSASEPSLLHPLVMTSLV